MAAIQLARQRGATVCHGECLQARDLREMGVEYVYDSRTTDFADQILADTNGAGVDVVLNSLTNEGFIEATVRATASGGRLAEIANRHLDLRADGGGAARHRLWRHRAGRDDDDDPAHISRLMAELSEGLAIGEGHRYPPRSTCPPRPGRPSGACSRPGISARSWCRCRNPRPRGDRELSR